jgi:hypothetical protein
MQQHPVQLTGRNTLLFCTRENKGWRVLYFAVSLPATFSPCLCLYHILIITAAGSTKFLYNWPRISKPHGACFGCCCCRVSDSTRYYRLVRKPGAHYRFKNSPSLIPVYNQLSRRNIFYSFCWKCILILRFPLCLDVPTVLLASHKFFRRNYCRQFAIYAKISFWLKQGTQKQHNYFIFHGGRKSG